MRFLCCGPLKTSTEDDSDLFPTAKQKALSHRQTIPAPSGTRQNTWKPATFGFKQEIQPNETSPPYISDMCDATLEQLLRAKNEHSFDDMAAYKTFLVMDETMCWGRRVGDAIRYTGWVLSALLGAYMVTSRGYFMHYINETPGILLPEENEDLQFLLRLTRKEGLGGIVLEMNGYTTFRNKAVFAELQNLVMALKDDTTLQPDEKHVRVQAKVREMLHSVSPGWDLRGLTKNMTQWFDLFQQASDASQGAPVAYLGLAIAQAIQRARRDFNESRRQGKPSTPLKIIILTGSELTETDYENLKKELKAVDGGASEFSVTVIYFGNTGTTSKDNHRRNKLLDDQRKDAADIYEAIFLNAHETLNKGLGLAFFIKALFSHDSSIDKWKVQDHEWYGPEVINHGLNHNLKVPTTEQIAAKLDVQTITRRMAPAMESGASVSKC